MSFFIEESCSEIEEFEDLTNKFPIKKKENLEEDEALLVYKDQILQIYFPTKDKPIFCDFLSPSFVKEVQQGYGRSEGVFKVLRSQKKMKILDLTLGYGKDFFKSVLCGHDVTGVEQNLIPFSLVKDGMARFYKSEKRLELQEKFRSEEFKAQIFYGDSNSFIEKGEHYDLMIYDPMFEIQSKSGKAKKSIQFLRDHLEKDSKENISQLINKSHGYADALLFKCALNFNLEEETLLYKKRQTVFKGRGFKLLLLS